jgi:hypothetical protein
VHISSVTWTITKGITGIEDITGSSTEIIIDLYPNPASDLINISLTGNTGGRINLEIFDIQGKRLKVHSLNAGEVNSIDLHDMNQGIYVAKIFIDNNLVATRKLIRK